TMQPIVWTRCNQQAKGDWQYRCRIVQPDDVAGAIRLYGGHARRLPGPFCDLWQPPGPASDVSVGPRGSSVSWTSPPLPKLALKGVERPALQAQIVRSAGACPLKPDAAEVGFANVQPGRRQTVTSGLSPLEPAGPGT